MFNAFEVSAAHDQESIWNSFKFFVTSWKRNYSRGADARRIPRAVQTRTREEEIIFVDYGQMVQRRTAQKFLKIAIGWTEEYGQYLDSLVSIDFSYTAFRRKSVRDVKTIYTLGVNGQGPKPGPVNKGRIPTSSEQTSRSEAASGGIQIMYIPETFAIPTTTTWRKGKVGAAMEAMGMEQLVTIFLLLFTLVDATIMARLIYVLSHWGKNNSDVFREFRLLALAVPLWADGRCKHRTEPRASFTCHTRKCSRVYVAQVLEPSLKSCSTSFMFHHTVLSPHHSLHRFLHVHLVRLPLLRCYVLRCVHPLPLCKEGYALVDWLNSPPSQVQWVLIQTQIVVSPWNFCGHCSRSCSRGSCACSTQARVVSLVVELWIQSGFDSHLGGMGGVLTWHSRWAHSSLGCYDTRPGRLNMSSGAPISRFQQADQVSPVSAWMRGRECGRDGSDVVHACSHRRPRTSQRMSHCLTLGTSTEVSLMCCVRVALGALSLLLEFFTVMYAATVLRRIWCAIRASPSTPRCLSHPRDCLRWMFFSSLFDTAGPPRGRLPSMPWLTWSRKNGLNRLACSTRPILIVKSNFEIVGRCICKASASPQGCLCDFREYHLACWSVPALQQTQCLVEFQSRVPRAKRELAASWGEAVPFRSGVPLYLSFFWCPQFWGFVLQVLYPWCVNFTYRAGHDSKLVATRVAHTHSSRAQECRIVF